MAAQKAADFRVQDASSLASRLHNLRDEQFNLRFQHATGQLENTARMGQVRKEIARIKTVMTEKREAVK